MSSGTLLRVEGSILGALFALFLGFGAPEGGNGALFTVQFIAPVFSIGSCWELFGCGRGTARLDERC